MIVKVSSHKRASIQYHFDNGNVVSIVFGGGTYSDNHMNTKEILNMGDFETYESTTVEVMVNGHYKYEQWFMDNYGDGDNNPVGYIAVEHIPLILAHADSRKYKRKE